MIRTNAQIPQREHNEHRMRRADSWLRRSEDADSDEERFICLWIAFNAAYGAEPNGADEEGLTETGRFTGFLREIIHRDEQNQKQLRTILWETFPGPIRILLDNQYVFKPFWQWVRNERESGGWRARFQRENDSIRRHMGNHDVHGVLKQVFRRLYQLRNQVFHGGVTFSAGWGRTQLRDGGRIMASIVPVILEVMRADIEAHPDSEVWGKVAYPRVGEEESAL